MNDRVEVVVVGAAGVDTCIYLPAEPFDPQQPLRLSDDAYFTQNIDAVGQAGGYASRGYATLGYATAYLGAIGDDLAGQGVRQGLTAAGIDISTCFLDPAGTARSINLVRPDGRRVACYDGRGNPDLQPDLSGASGLLEGARLCHLNVPNWARMVIPLAQEAGVPIVTDLQDVRSVDDPYRLDFVLGSHLVCFSTAHVGDPEPVMAAYWRRRPGLIQLAGMGEQGCAVGIDGRVYRFAPPDLPLPILDTNGAGDALCVGFVTALLLDGMDVPQAAARAQTAARITCAQRVPKQALATPQDLARWAETPPSG